MLSDARHERYAQYRAAGLTQAEAYRAAGYKGRPARTGGWNVEQRKGVKERIMEVSRERLQGRRDRRTGVAETDTIDQAWYVRAGKLLFEDARKQKDLGTASITMERMAKITGHWNEKPAPDGNNVIRVYSATPLTVDEWQRIYCPPEFQNVGSEHGPDSRSVAFCGDEPVPDQSPG
jgi:hypothetical protein